MSANGVKRKLDEEEDGLECVGALGPEPGPGGPPRGPYLLQRQTVLNVSLVKLYGPRGAEMGLRRRVLINNLVRHVYEQLQREGRVHTLFFAVPTPPAPAPAAAAAHPDGSYVGPPPPLSPPPLPLSPPSLLPFGPLAAPSPLDTCLTPASLLEEDSPLFFALGPSPTSSPHLLPLPHPSRTLPPAQPKDSFSSALEEIEELCAPTPAPLPPPPHAPPSQTDRTPPLDVAVAGEEEEQEEEEEEEIKMDEPPSPPPPRPAPAPASPLRAAAPPPPCCQGGFLTDFALDDTLFTDIDPSMYDFCPCSLPAGGPGTAAAGGVGAAVGGKVAPVTLTDDLVVRAISGYGAAVAGSGSGSPQGQPFRMDLAELDHIMEVLVGS